MKFFYEIGTHEELREDFNKIASMVNVVREGPGMSQYTFTHLKVTKNMVERFAKKWNQENNEIVISMLRLVNEKMIKYQLE